MFKEIHVLPEFVRDEKDENYCYPEEYINHVFEYKNTYIYFSSNAFEQLNKDFIDQVITKIIKDNNNSLSKKIADIEPRFNKLNEKIGELIEICDNKIESNEFIELSNFMKTQLKEIPKTEIVSDISEEKVEQMISAQLETVYKYMQTELQNIPTIDSDAKPKLGILFALKEAGYSPQEIGELKSQNLI